MASAQETPKDRVSRFIAASVSFPLLDTFRGYWDIIAPHSSFKALVYLLALTQSSFAVTTPFSSSRNSTTVYTGTPASSQGSSSSILISSLSDSSESESKSTVNTPTTPGSASSYPGIFSFEHYSDNSRNGTRPKFGLFSAKLLGESSTSASNSSNGSSSGTKSSSGSTNSGPTTTTDNTPGGDGGSTTKSTGPSSTTNVVMITSFSTPVSIQSTSFIDGVTGNSVITTTNSNGHTGPVIALFPCLLFCGGGGGVELLRNIPITPGVYKPPNLPTITIGDDLEPTPQTETDTGKSTQASSTTSPSPMSQSMTLENLAPWATPEGTQNDLDWEGSDNYDLAAASSVASDVEAMLSSWGMYDDSGSSTTFSANSTTSETSTSTTSQSTSPSTSLSTSITSSSKPQTTRTPSSTSTPSTSTTTATTAPTINVDLGILICSLDPQGLPAYDFSLSSGNSAISYFCDFMGEEGYKFDPSAADPSAGVEDRTQAYHYNNGVIDPIYMSLTMEPAEECPVLDFGADRDGSIDTCKERLGDPVNLCNVKWCRINVHNGYTYWKAGGTFFRDCITWNISRDTWRDGAPTSDGYVVPPTCFNPNSRKERRWFRGC
ncbi:hypothetical protein K490DRAFT_56849 [Saccharata proteae CBS 121410]|uniref:Uncharacterized protein n=1 Tax=Saccharata proteae CBS 121410 TaxID=1314787 RepID=A0A9P4LXK6_9PEZI|nr:hypothetical protein K490DRAFT_56849 [Saccharata proteae CBS 121410]